MYGYIMRVRNGNDKLLVIDNHWIMFFRVARQFD